MAAVRRSHPEDVVVKVVRDLLGDDGATERHVSGRDALREGHDVWNDALVIGAEPAARATKAGHDLVEHEEDPVTIAERAQAPEVAVWWDEHPRRARDRLDQNCGDVLRPLVPDDLFHVRESFLDVRAEHGAIRIGVQEMDDTGDAGLRGPPPVIPTKRHGALGLAVERSPLREDLVALGVHARDLDRVLVRLATAGREDRLREIPGRDLGEKPRQRRATLLAE